MGTLASELGPHAGRIAGQPRLYVDANVPAGLVEFMRARLRWDVFFVLEHEDLRRARDGEHYRLARQLGRTLITLDRDYLDDERFPPAESGGVIVLAAPTEQGFLGLLTRLDGLFRGAVPPREGSGEETVLGGRKLHLHVDWTGRQEEGETYR
ncbi:MAG: hypothetical protein A3I61_11440 [Acidobacteria bacterium RIFCSPLOWO2_02_FULL_68_18]|nr:MAG: hypothetical protein A3I61_11440 [Acidobacteria bacterium RIFCSPLOWO2_02_FULL_68_18]OFW50673.1 MAG: hypothetical protein A3G77_17185 [Acidobacteria bacterium RIFCSPLOWO2_12_FULL_68_19]